MRNALLCALSALLLRATRATARRACHQAVGVLGKGPAPTVPGGMAVSKYPLPGFSRQCFVKVLGRRGRGPARPRP
eukprot:6123721-Lingulodinium_polyedra.AAC.1